MSVLDISVFCFVMWNIICNIQNQTCHTVASGFLSLISNTQPDSIINRKQVSWNWVDEKTLQTRMPFGQRPTSHLLIEDTYLLIKHLQFDRGMTLTWYDLYFIYDLDLRQVKPSYTDVQVAKLLYHICRLLKLTKS